MEMLRDRDAQRQDDREGDAKRWRRYESALDEDESTRGASEMRDADKRVYRGGE